MSETENEKGNAPVPPRELSPNERQFPKNEDGEEVPHEVEMVELSNAHVGREVKVEEPGKPAWHGLVDGWNPSGVYVRVATAGARFVVKPEYLSWVL
jgi:hypothetical protein